MPDAAQRTQPLVARCSLLVGDNQLTLIHLCISDGSSRSRSCLVKTLGLQFRGNTNPFSLLILIYLPVFMSTNDLYEPDDQWKPSLRRSSPLPSRTCCSKSSRSSEEEVDGRVPGKRMPDQGLRKPEFRN
ncbi:uncharacterized protein ARMOST_03987 [Armillaria ostoyae]|uniref:Uncharacterized protein n=1 Tax=Armillaria ostoyae TaxID=47428 RepID=A0A284QW47_ARMOS|nr:uncharacterized protein ARMOST_03987 [Armillaria ostoyae]